MIAEPEALIARGACRDAGARNRHEETCKVMGRTLEGKGFLAGDDAITCNRMTM